MTAARSTKIDLHATAFYHCMTRCVRRSFLCGSDFQTGKEYHHRKQWIVNRLKELTEVFAIKICAYAIMSNHYHLVLFVDQESAYSWTDEEIKYRWGKIFPTDAKNFEMLSLSKEMRQKKIDCWRERLTSISWFMRCLNEVIARRSNKEDGCTGRFWEGRFKSQALLDQAALLSTMAYVDLNPIRSKIAATPENSEFTSIYERIKVFTATQKYLTKIMQPKHLMPFHMSEIENKTHNNYIDFTLQDYLQLVDETGRILRDNKKGAISNKLSPIITRLKLKIDTWTQMVQSIESHFFYAVGDSFMLFQFSQNRNCKKTKGINAAKKFYTRSVA